jgi:hypothetical protein
MDTLTQPRTQLDTVMRWLPLAGAAYGVLSIAGDLVIGDFPDGETSAPKLVSYYATHHAQVARGGRIMEISVVALGLFVVALVVRARRSLSASALLAVGGAAFVMHEEWSADSYHLLGSIGSMHAVTPQALQAWHLAGSEFGSGMTLALFLLGVVVAAATRTLPRWTGWSALVLAVGQFAPPPWGFFAAMLTLVWAVAVGIALAVGPEPTP